MKKILAILGLLALLSQPVFAQTAVSPDDSSANTGTPAMGSGTGVDESSGIGTTNPQGQSTGNIGQPETNYGSNSDKTMRSLQKPGVYQEQESQTGGAAGISGDDATGNSKAVRGYW